MFNFFKSDKNKKYEAISKQILLWHKACMIGVDENSLKTPRPMVGAILFFIGSIDYVCQANNIDNETFAKITVELLNTMGFPEKISITILKNFYTQKIESEFARNANIEGGKKIAGFLSGKNEIAPLSFEVFVREWSENPNIGPDEVSLFDE
jgi:hypothetical protein